MYCYQCGQQIPDDAQQCPHCGADLAPWHENVPANLQEQLTHLQDELVKRQGEAERLQKLVPNIIEELAAREADITRLKRFIPNIIATGILDDPDRLRSARRDVTVLFADAVNFTHLSTSLDAESVFILINDLLGRLVDCVQRYGGLVDKFTGDGLMAVFGAPIAHENDAEMAVRAALDMQQAALEFASTARTQLGAPLQIRIGIHGGPAVAGILGTEEQASYTVIGQTVNVAARLEAQAPPGSILVSSRVFRHARAFFTFSAPESVSVKGLEQPLEVYEVLSRRSQPATARGVPGITGVYLGRDYELGQLRNTLVNFLTQHHGQFVLIEGEAGMGKSRLVSEWLSETMPGAFAIWRGHGLPYAQGLDYGVFRSLLRDALNVLSKSANWEARLSENLRPFIRNLAGLELTEEQERSISYLRPDLVKQLTMLALREWVLTAAQEHPLLLILDDFHWADDLSRETLETLLPLTDEAPVFFCVLTRPQTEYQLDMSMLDADHCHYLHIPPLSQEESYELLTLIVDLAGFPENVITTILKRAEGNPFYIEEFVRMLIEKEIVQFQDNRWRLTSPIALEQVDVPASLQGLMLARVDRLPQNLRHLLQDAAVVGLQFDAALLEEIERRLRSSENVHPMLERLADLGLLVLRPHVSAQTYTFRHILTQETIYRSILRNQRATMHRIVAESMEELYAEELERHAEVLALHYDRARVRDKALTYTLLAGERARRRFANREAIEYYGRALQLSQHVSNLQDERWQAAVGLADVQQHVGEYEEALPFYLAALEEHESITPAAKSGVMLKVARVWEKRGEVEQATTWYQQALAQLEAHTTPALETEAAAFAGLGWLHLRRGDLPEARRLMERAVALVDQTEHYEVLASTLNRLGAVYYNLGDLDRAAQAVERSLEIRERMGDLLGAARSSNNLGILKSNRGDLEGALSFYRRGLRAMEQIGDTEGIAIAHTNIGSLYIVRGEWEAAEENLRESFAIAQRIDNPYEIAQAHMNLGRLYLHKGDLPQAEHHFNAALTLYGQAGGTANPNQIEASILQGVLFLEQGDTAAAQQAAERSHRLLREVTGQEQGNGNVWGRYAQFMGRIALAQGDTAEALAQLQRAQEIFEKNHDFVELGRSAYWYARANLAAGQHKTATTTLKEARTLLARLGARPDLTRIEETLQVAGN